MLALIGLITFQACEGPEGPIGPEGPQGEPGIVIVGNTYEVEVDFSQANDYAKINNFPQQLVDGDAVLVYRMSAVDNGRDIWRLLPQNYFFNEGVLIYNFDYTLDDYSIFLDGAIDRSILNAQCTTDQIFRIIVVPSDLPARIDYSNYDAVTKMLGISDEDFQKI